VRMQLFVENQLVVPMASSFYFEAKINF